jgi:hypothetical protein
LARVLARVLAFLVPVPWHRLQAVVSALRRVRSGLSALTSGLRLALSAMR